MANTISSCFQCYLSGSSLSRSIAQENSGGQTLLVGGISSIIVGFVLVQLMHPFRMLPIACLAAIIIVNLKGLFAQFNDIVFYFRVNISECVSH
jgi:MFS superfamily sulfate permease-like transporter